MLADAMAAIQADIARIVSKKSLTVSDQIRYQQMQTIRKALLEQQASVLRGVGRVVEARRLEAAGRAIQLGNGMDAYVLDKLGRSALVRF
jgi:hypothetical protein